MVLTASQSAPPHDDDTPQGQEPVHSGSEAPQLLPNLIPLEPQDVQFERAFGGRVSLRFTTMSWNAGAGPFEIVPGQTDADSQLVYQRIYRADGSYDDRPAGRFVFHPQHQHMHFDNYATYALYSVDAGDTYRTESKTSFCLRDSRLYEPELAGAPRLPAYQECENAKQGLSVGWSDRYGYDLPGQALDVTDLPPGYYELTIVVDPENQIVESDEGDNIAGWGLYLDVEEDRIDILY
ncbi:MAG TPA: lysyl oxidase family protein [Dehalococcoidia bacterium]|nr:lysyl oxidase family protein [Dehalococcoidia bacterium]